MLRKLYNLIQKIFSIRYYFKLWFYKLLYSNVCWGKNINVSGYPLFRLLGDVTIGGNVTFTSNTKYNFVGVYKPCSVCVTKGATLTIGNNTGFSGVSIFCADSIKIGNFCNIGGNVSIWDSDFHPLNIEERRSHSQNIKTKPIIIKDDVFIGANSIILKGVTIGNGAIVGAGSVVTKDIPDGEIWAGNPARYIRKVEKQ